jgi:hypothetical protein
MKLDHTVLRGAYFETRVVSVWARSSTTTDRGATS